MTTFRDFDADAHNARIRAIGRPTQAQKAEMAATWNGNVTPVSEFERREHGTGMAEMPKPRVLSKFRNVKTDGYASKKEAGRAAELRLIQSAGTIRNLREQVEYELIPKQEGERACSYRADFVYDLLMVSGAWLPVVEDTKGVRTADYIIKRKLMLFVHGIRIAEV